jgi:hypothetical protein
MCARCTAAAPHSPLARAGPRLLRVEFTTVFDYLQLLRLIATRLQVSVGAASFIAHRGGRA